MAYYMFTMVSLGTLVHIDLLGLGEALYSMFIEGYFLTIPFVSTLPNPLISIACTMVFFQHKYINIFIMLLMSFTLLLS